MTSLRRSLLIVLGTVIVLALIGRPEAYVRTDQHPPTTEVRRNDFHALGLIAGQLGAGVQPMARLPERLTLPPGGTLWLTVPGQMLGRERVAALLAWVEQGGRLVLVPRAADLWQDDPLLKAAGLRLVEHDDDWLDARFGKDANFYAAQEAGVRYALPDGTAVTAGFDLARGVEPLDDDIAATLTARAAPDADAVAPAAPPDDDPLYEAVLLAIAMPARQPLLCDPAGCHAWQVRHGAGRLTVLAEGHAFTNTRIGEHDHAAIATLLLGPLPGSTLWVVYEEQVPSLFATVWNHAAFALLALALAVLLWVLSSAVRFGALRGGALADRRRLAEHVEAVGELLARDAAGRQALWQAASDDFRRTLHRRHPQAQGLDDLALAALIAGHARLDAAQVSAALAPLPADSDRDTLDARIRGLDTLRRLL